MLRILQYPPKPLSKREEKLLSNLEGIVSTNLKAIYEIGLALNNIREEKLYRLYGDFDDYCKERWDFGYRQAYRYISAAVVIENLTNWSNGNESEERYNPETLLPLNEAQTRPLAHLPPGEQGAVWAKAVKTAPEGKITARHVKRTVRDVAVQRIEGTVPQFKEAKENFEEPTKESREYYSCAKRSDKFNKGLQAFLDLISAELQSNWRYTSRSAALTALEIVREVIAEDGSCHRRSPSYIMHLSAQEKLRKKGFVIFRKYKKLMLIEKLYKRESWIVHGEYKSVQEMNAAFDELLVDDMHLGGWKTK